MQGSPGLAGPWGPAGVRGAWGAARRCLEHLTGHTATDGELQGSGVRVAASPWCAQQRRAKLHQLECSPSISLSSETAWPQDRASL